MPRRLIATTALAALAFLVPLAAGVAGQERVTVTVLATTDMHGFMLPYDYFTATPAPRGLAAAATLIEQVRRETPNTVLVDCGDTVQGSTLEGVHQATVRAGASTQPDPMMLAMNTIGYDAMVLGNHEFNYGLRNLAAARQAARFPWISANTLTDGSVPAFAPFIVKTVAGVKVAVIGITTPAIPEWEKPEQIRGLRWLSPDEGVERALAQLEAEKPDVVLVAAHTGLGHDPGTGKTRPGEVPGENGVWQVAERFPQLAAVVYGHTHQREPGLRVGNVLVVQPRNWAMEVARVDLVMTREPGGAWTLEGAASRLLPVTADTPADPKIAAIAAPYHEAAERYLDRPVATAAVDLSGARGRFEDTALVDAIQEVQLYYAKADVSLASLFQQQVRVPRGPVTVRQLAALYIYDNELYAIEGNGRMVREALENAARYFKTCPEPTCSTGPLVDRSVFGFNYDMAQGVDYEIDLTEPAGHRVKNLRFRGEPLRDDQPLRIAVNNYRAAGSAGYTMFRDAKILWRSGREVRDLMADYFIERRQLPDKADGNWRILPAKAVETLAAEDPAGR